MEQPSLSSTAFDERIKELKQDVSKQVRQLTEQAVLGAGAGSKALQSAAHEVPRLLDAIRDLQAEIDGSDDVGVLSMTTAEHMSASAQLRVCTGAANALQALIAVGDGLEDVADHVDDGQYVKAAAALTDASTALSRLSREGVPLVTATAEDASEDIGAGAGAGADADASAPDDQSGAADVVREQRTRAARAIAVLGAQLRVREAALRTRLLQLVLASVRVGSRAMDVRRAVAGAGAGGSAGAQLSDVWAAAHMCGGLDRCVDALAQALLRTLLPAVVAAAPAAQEVAATPHGMALRFGAGADAAAGAAGDADTGAGAEAEAEAGTEAGAEARAEEVNRACDAVLSVLDFVQTEVWRGCSPALVRDASRALWTALYAPESARGLKALLESRLESAVPGDPAALAPFASALRAEAFDEARKDRGFRGPADDADGGAADGEDWALARCSLDPEAVFARRQRAWALAEVRRAARAPYRVHARVVEDAEEESALTRWAGAGSRDPAKEAADEAGCFRAPRCRVSVAARRVVAVLHEVMARAGRSGPGCAAVLYATARDAVDCFRVLVPLAHETRLSGQAPSLRLAALFHNDCFYVRHHCCALGPRYRDALPAPLSATATFVDLAAALSWDGERVLERARARVAARVAGLLQGMETSEWAEAEAAVEAAVDALLEAAEEVADVLPAQAHRRVTATLATGVLQTTLARVLPMQMREAEARRGAVTVLLASLRARGALVSQLERPGGDDSDSDVDADADGDADADADGDGDASASRAVGAHRRSGAQPRAAAAGRRGEAGALAARRVRAYLPAVGKVEAVVTALRAPGQEHVLELASDGLLRSLNDTEVLSLGRALGMDEDALLQATRTGETDNRPV